MQKEKIQYAEDDTEPVRLLLRLRLPSLVVGLFLGVVLSFIVSRFEAVIAKNISVAFFIPFVVYLADAVGTQTQSIYTRDLKTGKAKFKKYLFKETVLGLALGIVFGLIVGAVVMAWFKSVDLALAVSLATLGAVASAPLVALVVTEIFQLEHEDPAVGAGPIATIIQDTVSVIIYGLIASAIIL